MKDLHLTEVPDDVYEAIERRARAAGRSPEQEAGAMLARDVAADAREAALLEEIRKGHQEMAKSGIFATADEIRSAIEWGRE
jgi:plasmid stability protein